WRAAARARCPGDPCRRESKLDQDSCHPRSAKAFALRRSGLPFAVARPPSPKGFGASAVARCASGGGKPSGERPSLGEGLRAAPFLKALPPRVRSPSIDAECVDLVVAAAFHAGPGVARAPVDAAIHDGWSGVHRAAGA